MKYLIYCGPGIGDFLIALPMAAAIKNSDPKSFIRMITTSSRERIKLSKTLLSLQNYVDDIDYYSHVEKTHSIKMLFRNGYKIFDYGFVIQYTANSNTSSLPSKIVRIASKITCGLKVPDKKIIKYDYFIDYKHGTNIYEYPLLMLKAVGLNYPIVRKPLLDNDKISKCLPPFIIKTQKKLITLCVGTANVSFKINGTSIDNDSKNWPYDYWVELANNLAEKGYDVILLGGKKEEIEFEVYKEKLSNKYIRIYLGCLKIEESLAVLQISDLVVGADTGMMHCSAALAKPLLALFGCTDYNEYLPAGEKSHYISSNEDCSPCFGTELSVLCKNKKCMYNLTPQTIIKKIESIV